MPNAALVNFAAGETSPRSRGRFDLDWFRSSAQKILNFIPEVSGPARYRQGFKYVRQTRGGAEARLIPFQLNSSRGYMLEFTPGKMRVYKDGDLLTKTPYGLLTAVDTLDNFTDGDYTSSPVWTPYIAGGLAVTSNRLVATVPVTNEGIGATTPNTRNIGAFEFDAEISSAGEVAFFATTYVPTVNAAGITSYTCTGYAVRRTAAGNYIFGRLSGSGTFTTLLDLGITGSGLKGFKFVRDSVGLWTCYAGTVGSPALIGAVLDNTYSTVTLFAVQATTASGNTLTIDNIKIPSAGATDNQGVITGITRANPAVVTVSAVGDLANGDECIVEDVVGMLEMNGRQVKLAGNVGSTFQLVDPVTGSNINSSSFTAYGSGGRLKEIYEIDTPYYAPDLDDLSWAIDARNGVMYIAHPKYAPRKLTVDSAENFTLTTFTRTNDPFTNSPATLTITGIDRASTGTLIYFTPGSVINPNHTYTFAGISGTTQLNAGTYRLRVPSGSFSTPRAYLVTTTGEAEVDSSAWGAWTAGGTATPDVEHPIACAMYESRLFWLGTSVRTNTLLGSRAPDDNGNPRYDDHTGGADADHAVAFALAPTNGQIDTVAWGRGTSKYLYVGTFGGPFRISGAGLDEPITPDSINVRQFDSFGCEAMTPAVASRVFWIQRGGKTIRTARYSPEADDLRSYDMMLNAEHIGESRLRRVVLQAGRPDILWVIREDGVLAGLTVQGEENVAGWHRHKLGGTAAKVLDAQALARTDRDDQLWIVSERTVGGTTRRFVEVMADDVFFPDRDDFYSDDDSETDDDEAWRGALYRRQEEYIHLDGAGTYDGSDRGTDAGATLTPGAVSGSGVTFTASAAVFAAADVGKEIWKKPNRDTGLGGGKGEIVGFTDTTHVTVDIDPDCPFDAVTAIAAGDWYFAADTIYGLAHFDGESVKVVGDGAVFDDETVALGKISLDQKVAVAHVGLGYDGFLKTQNLELAIGGGPAQAKPRLIVEVFIRFLATLGVNFGTGIYRTDQIEYRTAADALDRPAPVFSGIRRVGVEDAHESEEGKHIVVAQRLPLPCVVQFVDVHFETTEAGT
jgi:hypothetical protein